MSKSIAEQVVVITGASSGIGLVTARMAARRGARVVLAARNAGDLEREVEDILREGGEAVAVPTDVTDYAQVEALAARAVEAFGRIDAWVNNAGVSLYAPFKEMSLEDFRRVVEVDFFGQVHGARAALPHLEASAGALICVGSALSDRGVPLQSAYCAAKHGVKGWLDALRIELQEEGSSVRVTLVKPSSINTPLFNKAKTQIGVMPQPIPPIYEPELAARVILRVAEGKERDAFVGGSGKVLSVAERVSPKLLDVHQRHFGFDSQMTSWPKRPDSPSNLYDPMESDGGPRGDFLHRSTRRSAFQRVTAHPAAASLVAAAGLGVAARSLGARRPELAVLAASAAALLAGKGLLSRFYLG